VPIPSEVTFGFGGVLAAQGHLNIVGVIIAGTVAELIGSLVSYGIGRVGGRPLVAKYGRYLLIASSRQGSQASTLQGIWNADRTPPWNSNWTTNINTQMNYWPAEITALPECHEPLIALVEDLAVSGRHTARVYYGARGWTAHHNVDI